MWQVYQLQTELQKVQLENKLQRQGSLRRASLNKTPQLQEEVQKLRCQLMKAEKLDPVRAITSSLCVISADLVTVVTHSCLCLLCLCQAHQDILAQDLAEAIDSQVELAEQLRCYREENEQLLMEKQGVCVFVCQSMLNSNANSTTPLHAAQWRAKVGIYLEEHSLFSVCSSTNNGCICVQLMDQKEGLSLQVQQLTLDCNMHQHKTTMVHNQLRELQAERDQVRDR